MANEVKVVVPWDSKLSKNARTSFKSGNITRVFIVKEVRELQESLRETFANSGGVWYDAKVWINIFVEMPSRKSDAINVLDTIADAIKKGIEIDDKWFCISGIDWEIKRENPMVTITVTQYANADVRFCSTCKGQFPLTEEFFPKRRVHYKGLSPTCKTCQYIENENNRIKNKEF